jgi:hypothetical protein
MSEDAGLAALLGAGRHRECAITGISAVGLLDLTCKLEVVLGGPFETLAQAIHQAYLYDRLAAGQTFGSSAALVSWDRMDEGLKESNREQARHVPQKLARIGCEIRIDLLHELVKHAVPAHAELLIHQRLFEIDDFVLQLTNLG